MRNIFQGYYPPTDAEFEHLWSQGLLVPDTNVLFHIFRFMPKQRQEVLAAFDSFGHRLWLPFQVGREFQQRWRSADNQNRGAYSKLKEDLDKKKREVEALIRSFNRYDPWQKGSPMNRVADFFETLSKEVDAATDRLPEADVVFDAVTKLFDGKVAEKPKESDIAIRMKEAERRALAKIPPGYMDNGSGDFLIWEEIKEKAKTAKVPILFVTDDGKEDWWLEQSGKTVGPRPELREEFAFETGQMFYAYSPTRFLSLVADRTKDLVSAETVEKMQRVERVGSQPTLFQEDYSDRVRWIAQAINVEPLIVLTLARRIATTRAIIDRIIFFPGSDNPPDIQYLKTETERWVSMAEEMIFKVKLDPDDRDRTRAASDTWSEFLKVIDELYPEELERITTRKGPKRAIF